MTGHWVDLNLSWHDTLVVQCEVCGCLIPRRTWVFAYAGREIRACKPSCERLYARYVVPTYGKEGADAHH